MSFTFSHPAVVLPLIALPRKWRSATGLIVGSLAPDFEKFIKMSEHDPHSHTWSGIFYFNLPLGLLLAFLFHLVVRDPLIKNLPKFLRARFLVYLDFDWVACFRDKYLVVILSLLVGAFSHLALDILTHTPGHREQLLPFMDREIFNAPFSENMDLPVQIAVSLVGALVLIWFVYSLPKLYKPRSRNISRYWLVVTALTLAIVAVKSQVGEGIIQDPYHPIIVCISAGMCSLLIAPFLLRKRSSS